MNDRTDHAQRHVAVALAVAVGAATSACLPLQALEHVRVVEADAAMTTPTIPAPAQSLLPMALVQAILRDATAQGATHEAMIGAVDSVTWRDGSLGCPGPGTQYAQALVPGWRVVISDGARQWLYHASKRGAWVRCDPQRAVPPVDGGSDNGI